MLFRSVIPHIRIQRDEAFTLFDTAKTKPLSKAVIGDKLQELRDKILDNTLTEDDMKFIQLHTGYDKDWFFINVDLVKNTKTVVKQQLKLLKSKETLTDENKTIDNKVILKKVAPAINVSVK